MEPLTTIPNLETHRSPTITLKHSPSFLKRHVKSLQDELQGRHVRTTPDIMDMNGAGEDLRPFVFKPWFRICIAIAIVANSMSMGLEIEAPSGSTARVFYRVLEYFFIAVFFLETLFKLYYLGRTYFADSWNCFDFAIVSCSVIDVIIMFILEVVVGQEFDNVLKSVSVLRVFRLFRVLRVAKMVRIYSTMLLIVEGLLHSLKTVLWTSLLLLMFVYACAIFTTRMIGQNTHAYDPRFVNEEIDGFEEQAVTSPEGYNNFRFYGTLGRSMFTLTEIVIQAEGTEWRSVVERQPELTPFFLGFIAFSTFGILNVIIGIIVDNTISNSHIELDEQDKAVLAKKVGILNEIRDICFLMDDDGDGFITTEEMQRAFETTPNLGSLIEAAGVSLPVDFTAEDLCSLLDPDGQGRVSGDAFVSHFYRLAEGGQMFFLNHSVNQLTTMTLGIANRLETAEAKVEEVGGKVELVWKKLRSDGSSPSREGREKDRAPPDIEERPDAHYSKSTHRPAATVVSGFQPWPQERDKLSYPFRCSVSEPAVSTSAGADGSVELASLQSGCELEASGLSVDHAGAAGNIGEDSDRLQVVEVKLERIAGLLDSLVSSLSDRISSGDHHALGFSRASLAASFTPSVPHLHDVGVPSFLDLSKLTASPQEPEKVTVPQSPRRSGSCTPPLAEDLLGVSDAHSVARSMPVPLWRSAASSVGSRTPPLTPQHLSPTLSDRAPSYHEDDSVTPSEFGVSRGREAFLRPQSGEPTPPREECSSSPQRRSPQQRSSLVLPPREDSIISAELAVLPERRAFPGLLSPSHMDIGAPVSPFARV